MVLFTDLSGDLLAAPSPVSRRLKRIARKSCADAIYEVQGRLTHDLLGYKPTYRSWIKKKPKKRPRKSKVSRTISEAERRLLEEKPLESFQGQERIPVDRVSPDPSDTMPPKIDLKAKLAEMASKAKKDAPKKSTPRATAIPDKVPATTVHKTTTARSKGTASVEERAAKWVKISEIHTIEDDLPGADQGVDSSFIVQQPDSSQVEGSLRPFSPVLVKEDDSVAENTRLAMGLLPGLALKKDLELVPNKLEDNLFHCTAQIVKVISPISELCSFSFVYLFDTNAMFGTVGRTIDVQTL